MPMTLEQSRRPNTFWRLVPHDSPKVRDVVARDFGPKHFNYLRLINGQIYDGNLPSEVRLRLEHSNKPVADYVANSMGWPIMSERLVTQLRVFFKDAVKLIPAPLFELNTDELVPGYFILNVIKRCDCVDVEKSVGWYTKDGSLGGFDDVCIDPTKARGCDIFKYVIPPDRIDFGVTCSFDLVKSLEGKGFSGLAFLRCRSTDD
jgi:hypothetical protein